MPYLGTYLFVKRNDLFTLQEEGSFNTDPGVVDSADVVAFETITFRDAKETVQAATVRGSRTKEPKIDTLWSVEGEVEAVYRGGKVEGADSTVAVHVGNPAGGEGMWATLVGNHFGDYENNYDAILTVAASTVNVVNLDVGGGANYEVGDIIAWYDFTDSALIYRFVKSVTGDAVTVFPPLAASQVPAAGEITFSRQQYRFLATFFQHPTLFAKAFRGFNVTAPLKQSFGGLLVNEMSINMPLADLIKFNFSLRGVRATVDPSVGAMAGTATFPRNPNLPLVGLRQTMLHWSRDNIESYGLKPLALSVTSSFDVHPIATLCDANTHRANRLGMREVTAQLEVLLDDASVLNDFRDSDRVAIMAFAGRESYHRNAAWSPFAFNGFIIGLPQCSIDDVTVEEHEDAYKATLTLMAEAPDYGQTVTGSQFGWDKEFSMIDLGSANV